MKTAVVTGGSRGIGLATAKALFERGYVVYALYSSDEESVSKAREILPYVDFVRCDVSDERSVSEFFDGLKRVDVLVNNAGTAMIKQIQDTSLEDWNRIFSVNMTGTFLSSREAVKKMLSTGGGNIVNVSSMWGEVGASCEVAYSASKSAVIGFTKALAKELAYSNIRVNCVSPGVIDTKMNDLLSPEDKKAIEEEIPSGRMGRAEEVASAILSVIENDYIDGVILPVNGGYII